MVLSANALEFAANVAFRLTTGPLKFFYAHGDVSCET